MMNLPLREALDQLQDRLSQNETPVPLWVWQDSLAHKTYNEHIKPLERLIQQPCCLWMKEWDNYLDEEFMAWLFFSSFCIMAIGLQDEEYAATCLNYFGLAATLRILRLTKSWQKQVLRDHFLFWQMPNAIILLSVPLFYDERSKDVSLHRVIDDQVRKSARLIFSILMALLIAAHISVFFLMVTTLRRINNNYSSLKNLALAGTLPSPIEMSHPVSTVGRVRELAKLWSARKSALSLKILKDFISKSASPRAAYTEQVVRQHIADFYSFKLQSIPECWEAAKCFVCESPLELNEVCCYPLSIKTYALHRSCLLTSDYRVITQMVSFDALISRMSYPLDATKLPDKELSVCREHTVLPSEMIQWDRIAAYEGRIVPSQPRIIACF